MSKCLKIQKSKPIDCSKEVQLILLPRAEGSFSHRNLGIRHRVVEAVVWLLSLWASALVSHWICTLSWLSALKELHTKAFYVSAKN